MGKIVLDTEELNKLRFETWRRVCKESSRDVWKSMNKYMTKKQRERALKRLSKGDGYDT